MKLLLVAMALSLLVPGTAQAAGRCGRASAPAGAGMLELSLWQEDAGMPSEHATLSIPSRDDRFVMVLAYRPARGQIGAPNMVRAFAYAPWQRQVRLGEVLGITVGGARWQGPPRMTELSSRSGRPGTAAEYLVAGYRAQADPELIRTFARAAPEYLVAGDREQADPALIRAFAAGGKVRLARVTKDGSRIKDVVALPRPKALGKAYQAARAQAVAALGPCQPPSISPVSAP